MKTFGDRIKNYGKDPRDENEEGTQLGCDEWGTEYVETPRLQIDSPQILNRNCKGNVTKERDELTQGLSKLTTDEPRVSVQVRQVLSRIENIEYNKSDEAVFAIK